MRSPRSLVLTSLLTVTAVMSQGGHAAQLSAQTVNPPPVYVPQTMPEFPSGTLADDSLAGDGQFAPELYEEAASTNPMLWQQYQALQVGGTIEGSSKGCSTCGGSSDYHRCGCNTELFPWICGPGSCDRFCVGPKWAVDVGGLMIFRDDADWDRVIADVGLAPTLVDQFKHGPGGRVFVTGYNEYGYGVQVGYEGINDWIANLHFANAGGFTREITYQSRLNSVEVNFLPATESSWKWFSGFRYVQFDEDYLDFNRADRVLPPPAAPPGTAQTIDTALNRLLENRLIGFQLGSRRDAWQFGNRFTIQTFANAGVYCNKFRREDVELTITKTITGDDTATTDATELTETSSTFITGSRDDVAKMAFVGEAGLAAVWRLNHCFAVRSGYQILALEGVGDGLIASFEPGLAEPTETLIFHGLQFGLEYRR